MENLFIISWFSVGLIMAVANIVYECKSNKEYSYGNLLTSLLLLLAGWLSAIGVILFFAVVLFQDIKDKKLF